MPQYKLTTLAVKDIDKIYEDGLEKFGKAQAIVYLENISSYFDLLGSNPYIGKHRTEIKNTLYSFPCKSHIIFYRIFKSHIRIIRILYGGMDLIKFLK